jgi:hypothetical protein
MQASRARATNTAPPTEPPTIAPTWEVYWLSLVWAVVESELEMIAPTGEEEGEGEGEEIKDWLLAEEETIGTKLEVINVLELSWVLVVVGMVVVTSSTVLAVALASGEDAVLDCTDVVKEEDTGSSSEELVCASAFECPTTGGRYTELCAAAAEKDAGSSVDHVAVVIAVVVLSGTSTVSCEVVEPVDRAICTVCV